MPRRRPEFEPDAVGIEAAKLEKFSDADGSQIQWLSDAGRFTFFDRSQYIPLSPYYPLNQENSVYIPKPQLVKIAY